MKQASLLLFSSILLSGVAVPLLAQSGTPIVKLASLPLLNPEGYTYRVGEPFKLNVDYSSLSEDERRRLRIRIFRGTPASLIKNISKRIVGNCVVYPSIVLIPSKYDGGIDLGINFNESWLQPKGTSTLGDANYLLFLELEGPGGTEIKLEKTVVNLYFQQGYPFVVRANGTLAKRQMEEEVTKIQQNRSRFEARLGQLRAEEALVTAEKQTPCWEFQVVHTRTTMLTALMHAACKDGRRRNVYFRAFQG